MEKYKDKKVAILGFGVEGKDAAKFFLQNGAEVTVFDQKDVKDSDLSDLPEDKIKFICGVGYLDNSFQAFDLLVRSPGIYRFLPQIVEAEKSGTIITSNIKLFFDLCNVQIIGITGTKGKGTTSTLIYEILKESGCDVVLGGNIGKPALGLLKDLTANSLVVLEMSSFQLIDLHKSPHISVVLNITSDHMDWHKDRDEYVNAKLNIVKHQTKKDFSVINFDYSDSKNFSNDTQGKTYFFSSHKKVDGCCVLNGKICLTANGEYVEIVNTKDLLLRGEHNWENINAAVCAAYLAGANIESIRTVVKKFKGLEHRLELVRVFNNISFYNDSFSTNPQTTTAAIDAFKEPVILILGGSDKGLNYDDMALKIANSSNVKGIILIGQISEFIKNSLNKNGYNGYLVNLGMTNMQTIISEVMKVAKSGDVVLLSPATASFGMFLDYKDRGNQFKEVVLDL